MRDKNILDNSGRIDVDGNLHIGDTIVYNVYDNSQYAALKESIDDLTELVRLSPKNAQYAQRLSAKKGELAEVERGIINIAEQVIKGDNAEVAQRIDRMILKGNYEEALELIDGLDLSTKESDNRRMMTALTTSNNELARTFYSKGQVYYLQKRINNWQYKLFKCLKQAGELSTDPDLLSSVGEEYKYFYQYSEAIFYLEKAVIYETNEFKLINTHLYLTHMSRLNRDINKCAYYLAKCKEAIDALGDICNNKFARVLMARYKGNMGIYYKEFSDFDLALAFCHDAYTQFKALLGNGFDSLIHRDLQITAITLSHLYSTTDSKKAFYYATQSIAYGELIEVREDDRDVKMNILRGKLAKSPYLEEVGGIHLYASLMAIKEEVEHMYSLDPQPYSADLASVYGTIGDIYYREEHFVKAIEYQKKVVGIVETYLRDFEQGDEFKLNSHSILALCYWKLRKRHEARKHRNLARKIYKTNSALVQRKPAFASWQAVLNKTIK